MRLTDEVLARDAGAFVDALGARIDAASPVVARGRVSRCVGLVIHATGIQARVGELCELVTPGAPDLLAEVVGFDAGGCLLTPLGTIAGLSSATEVRPCGRGLLSPVGRGLLGRVLDALGRPIDGRGPLAASDFRPTRRAPPDPLARARVDRAISTGVRAIDGLLAFGVGQRVGVFAPPGAGKSTLLGMLARGASADVNVVALIGERGREVREFVEDNLDAEARARTVVVVSTSDRPPTERLHSALVATTIAEHFRDRGLSVLLLVDSLTRCARAQREIGLASGEPPTRRSYPPSTFSLLPQLLERAGQGERGAITAVYTVLTEGDEANDPIAEDVRAILDGHVVLSRELAASGHHPAIDVLASVSRVMAQVATPAHRAAAARARSLLAKFREVEVLVQMGEYRAGADPLADAAIAARPALLDFLRQGTHEPGTLADAVQRLEALLARAGVAGGATP